MAPIQMGCINIRGINRKFNHLKNGGVALLVAQNLASTPHTLPNHLNHLEAVVANLHLQNMSILIISYYNRPQDRVSADLLRYAAQHNFAIVLGDFNARHTDFGDTQTNPNGRSLNSLIITLPLCRLHNTDPTFLSHTGCSISDHILSTENFVPFLWPSSPPPAFIPITNFKQADWQKFQQLVSDNLPVIAPTVDFLTVDRQVAQFTEVLKTAQSQSVPRAVVDSCRLLDYRNGKKFWTQLQTLTGQKTTTVHHLVRNNAIINTPLEKANCYAETLEQIHQVPNDPHFNDAFFAQVIRSVNNFRRNPPNHPLRLLPEDDSLVVEVLPDEVEAHIRQLKSKKAPGPDELKAPIFKNLPRIAIVALTVIFNNCMRAHHFPPAWKHATTVMIPKPGKDPTNPLSYRPISLLNIAGKSILMSYSGARSRHQAPHLLLNNQAIPKLQHIRYLGVTFSKNCTLNQDVKETFKKSRNRANLLYRIRGRIRGCDSKTLYHTYKSYIRPVIEYRAPIYATLYPALLHQISACERRMLRRIFRLPDRFPSDNLHQETNTIPIQSRLKELQSRYVTRTLNSNNALAIQTLKIPKAKLKHPPTALLSPAYTDLPDDFQELVDSTSLTMR
ncbi:hypothetical protein MTP99_003042 [Tenebrio molitor]|nr:hypothetical protein MTP99_003042 [Tenebrio molitor]